MINGALPQPSSLRTPTLPLPLHFLPHIFWSSALSSTLVSALEPYYKIHRLAHPLVFISYKRVWSRKPVVLFLPPGQWLEGLFCSQTRGLRSSACELGALLSASHRCEEAAPGRTLDCGPFSLPSPDLISFWCSYATEVGERGEKLSLEPILTL